MAGHAKHLFFFFTISHLFIIFSVSTTSIPPQASFPMYPSPSQRRAGIKAAYWPTFTGLPIAAINTYFFTHIYYAFLLPDPTTFTLSITPTDLQLLPQFSTTLKSQNPSIHTMLSIGGAGNDPTVFSAIAGCTTRRATFISSAIDVARRYGFDGLDLDWEFPATQDDMKNLGALYKQWRIALHDEARATGRAELMLSSAVYFAAEFFLDPVVRSYPSKSMSENLDWVSPMCFDYHGSWSNFTGEHAALYDPNSNISTSYGIGSWLGGVPASKVVMGMPLYGRTWQLKDSGVNGVGAPTMGPGPGNGTMVYADIVGFNIGRNASVVPDERLGSVYSYAGDDWIGYEDDLTVEKKVQWAKVHGLGGYFFWALGQDKDWSISEKAWSTWEQ